MNVAFALAIEDWYARHGRTLPWRQTRDAYRIWISEIVLQQTRVEQGLAYYERFIKHLPTVEALASAPEEEVMRLWQGLGYYSRARNLHEAAKQVVAQGRFPQTYKEILLLKGVGRYTAAAIASFAFGEAQAVVDGNVYRVLSRYLDEPTPIDNASGQRLFAALAQEMMDEKRPALYNQAIMDFGALHCTPHNPLCAECPLSASCAALHAGTVMERPVKTHRTRVTDRYLTFVYMTNSKGQIALQQRLQKDIWQGLFQFPLLESSHPLSPDDIVHQLPSGELTLLEHDFVHQLSHQRLHTDFYRLRLSDAAPLPSFLWITAEELDHFALPRLLTRLMEKHGV